MKRLSLFFVDTILILLILSYSEKPSDAENSSGTIKGMVNDGTENTPIKSVLLTTEPPSEAILSKNDGSYEIINVPMGNVVVIAEKEGYYTKRITVKVIGAILLLHKYP